MFPDFLLTAVGILLALGAIATLSLFALQFSSIRIRTEVEHDLKDSPQQFLSIHVPICSEPPEIVIATLQAIASQGYQHYEVLIIDNNTEDPELWKPVERFCRGYQRFRFIHVSSLAGYKAGALNLARRLTSAQAQYLITVDADYQLAPGALGILNRAIGAAAEDTALIQFPQAYRNAAGTGFAGEYAHFFDAYLSSADVQNEILGTGTLSCIRIAALDDVGGWPTDSITEDAALGIRFIAAGWNGTFVHRTIGKGLIPVDINTHVKQRARWIYGNAQVLYQKLLRVGSPPSRAEFVQLTAWISLLGPVIVAHILLITLLLTGTKISFFYWLGLASIYGGFFLGKYFIFKRAAELRERSRKGVLGALLIHLNYGWLSSWCWWGVLRGREKPFIRSCKSGRDSYLSELSWLLPGLMSLTVFLLSVSVPWLALPFVPLTFLLVYSRFYYLEQIEFVRKGRSLSATAGTVITSLNNAA